MSLAAGRLSARLVDPARDPALSAAFAEGLTRCYARYGAAHDKADVDPRSGHVCMVVVLDERGAVVAGTRIHRRAPGHALPVERILATHSGVRRGLDWRQPSGVGEVAGLWASPALAGTGIGGPIVATAVAHASALGMAHLVGFAHQYNRFTRRVGFEPDRSLGEHAYPDGRYRSTVNWCDALGLTSADSFFRGMILDLRRRVLRGERLWLTPGESGAAASSGA